MSKAGGSLKKPKSLIEIFLNIVKVCFVTAISVCLIRGYLKSVQTEQIIINLPPTTVTVLTTASTPAVSETITYTVASVSAEPDDSKENIPDEESAAQVVTVTPQSEMKVESPESAYTSQSSDSVPVSQSMLININTATAEQLMTLSGIGEVKAEAIISYRKEIGGFQNINQLLNVKGIGQKTFDKIQAYITV